MSAMLQHNLRFTGEKIAVLNLPATYSSSLGSKFLRVATYATSMQSESLFLI